MTCLHPLPVRLYFWMFLLADHLFSVTALIILSTGGFSCVVMSWGSLCYLNLVQFSGLVVSLQCKIRANCMASREGSAKLTCEERFICWVFALVGFCHPAQLQAAWAGAHWPFRGAQHVSGQSPELAVSKGHENDHRGWGKDVKLNKFEEYIRKRGWGTVQKAEMEEAEYLQSWWHLHHGSASLRTPFPSWEPSFRITGGVPPLVIQLPLMKRLCFCISLSSSALQAINKHKLIPNSPSPCCR